MKHVQLGESRIGVVLLLALDQATRNPTDSVRELAKHLLHVRDRLAGVDVERFNIRVDLLLEARLGGKVEIVALHVTRVRTVLADTNSYNVGLFTGDCGLIRTSTISTVREATATVCLEL